MPAGTASTHGVMVPPSERVRPIRWKEPILSRRRAKKRDPYFEGAAGLNETGAGHARRSGAVALVVGLGLLLAAHDGQTEERAGRDESENLSRSGDGEQGGHQR